jgi:DNA-binding transcriptional regulator LsrR (DeoR family)
MEYMNTDKKGKKLVEWRRSQTILYSSKGCDQATIARILHVGEATVSRDMTFLREQSKKVIQDYADNLLPIEYRKCLEGLNAILLRAWNISSQQDLDTKETVQALMLAKECYSMKLSLLTNASVIGDSMRFISRYKKQLLPQQQRQREEQVEEEQQQQKEEESAVF